MKTRTSRISLLGGIVAVSLAAFSAPAQNAAPPNTPLPTASTDATPVKLPYGVDDVLKLSRAQVSEDVTLNFIRSSGTIYSLTSSDILYLHNQGVSDRVINAMLDQRNNVPVAPAPQPAPVPAPAPADASAQAPAQYAPAYAQAAPVVQPETAYAPASTVYTIPYATPAYPYYGGYPYYYGPTIGIGFGFGYGGCYHGYHGAYYHGGYYHGGHYGHH